jgi:acetyl-CoA carboxylase carboxyltransferase component
MSSKEASHRKSITERLDEMNRIAELGGGESKIAQQHKKGKKTARERVSLFLDEGSFVEIDKLAVSPMSSGDLRQYGDGVVTGYGTVDGRTVFVFSHDFTVLGGSLGVMFGQKVAKVMDLALKAGAPVIGLNDSGGARIQEGVQSLAAYSQIFFRNTICSGVIPQISLVLGPCAGGAVYSPAMTDFVIMSEKSSYMFITGPDVVKAALGQDVTFEELGGPEPSSTESGVAHFVASTEEEAFALARQLLAYLPSNNSELPPQIASSDDPNREDPFLDSIVPSDSNKPYEMKQVVTTILDNKEFLEVHARWAPNIIVGFGRLDGASVGIVANQPSYLAGALDINSSQKAARFVRTCDAFNIPIITLVDVPGYMPGTEQEHGGIIRHGSKLLFAYCEATVPKVTIIIRKAYGGAYCAMGSKYSKADLNFAWPSAEIAVMGPEGATNIIYRNELEKSDDPSLKDRLVSDYKYKFANPFIAAETGIIDSIIKPSQTRREVVKALQTLEKKSEQRPAKKHGNIQL